VSKKYKLRRWYPSLPNGIKEGDEVWRPQSKGCKEFWGYTTDKLCMSGTSISVKEVENNPKFWEEIKEKNYKILSFKDKLNTGRIYRSQSNGLYTVDCNKILYDEDQLLRDANVTIHSVKRVSDNKIFTVGDKVKHWVSSITRYNKWIISSIEVKNGIVKLYSGTGFHMSLQEVTKREDSLFTTEDGVDIYRGDRYYMVRKLTNYNIDSMIAHSDSGKEKSRYTYFSTKEKAEEYIEENKPRYSKKDIKKAAKRACPFKSGLIFWGNINAILSELEDPYLMQ